MLSFLLFKSIAKGNSLLKVFKKSLPPHILDAEFVSANLDAARWYTSPLVKQGLASDRDLPGLQSHAGKRAYVSGKFRRILTVTASPPSSAVISSAGRSICPSLV